MIPIRITKEDKILIIAPHPDDESIGCGGLLSKFSDQCEVWVLADGRFGGSGNEETIKERRKAEFIQEMEILGINNFKRFDVFDYHLYEAEELLVSEDLSSYTKIFVTYANDEHPDHRMAYNIVKRALIKNKVKVELYQYEVWTPLHRGTHYLDISECIGQKMNAISVNESQIEDIDYCQMMKALASYRAEAMGKKGAYIEMFLMSDYINDNATDTSVELLKEKEKADKIITCYDRLLRLQCRNENICEKILMYYGRDVIIYGCGRIGKTLGKILSSRKEINLICYIDNYYNSNEYEGAPIKKQDDAFQNNDKAALVIVTIISEVEKLIKDLIGLGFKNISTLSDIIDL